MLPTRTDAVLLTGVTGFVGTAVALRLLERAWSPELPLQIVRPSIVVGDRTTGWTRSFNVLYWPLKMFARGRLPVVPAVASAPVDVVPVDYVAVGARAGPRLLPLLPPRGALRRPLGPRRPAAGRDRRRAAGRLLRPAHGPRAADRLGCTARLDHDIGW